jgi:hypothetical protein
MHATHTQTTTHLSRLQAKDKRLRTAEYELSKSKWAIIGKKMEEERQNSKSANRSLVEMLALTLIQDYDVSRKRVMSVIKEVAVVFGVDATKIPSLSRATLWRVEIAGLNLSDIQITEFLNEGDKKVTDLSTTSIQHDGTGKRNRDYYAVSLKRNGKSLLTNLMPLPDKTAQTSLDYFLASLKERWNNANGDDTSFYKLLLSICNNVSDQCATEGKFVKLLMNVILNINPYLNPNITHQHHYHHYHHHQHLTSLSSLSCRSTSPN